jgi:hypothetical protein
LKNSSHNEFVVCASSVVGEVSAKEGSLSAAIISVKHFWLAVAEEVCPDKKKAFKASPSQLKLVKSLYKNWDQMYLDSFMCRPRHVIVIDALHCIG